jgi:hypothetical protein
MNNFLLLPNNLPNKLKAVLILLSTSFKIVVLISVALNKINLVLIYENLTMEPAVIQKSVYSSGNMPEY